MKGLTVQHVLAARRELARRSLVSFTERSYPRYRAARHHHIIAGHLERVERREIDRLMLLLPPRHGKTELASRRYPAWNLGRNPHRQIIAASATETFATDIGREVRNIVADPDFANVFPGVTLSNDSSAAGRWHTSKGGVFSAVGVGTQILGKGADDFVIDDPFATMEDAQSEVKRKRVIEWYQGSVYNRLQPGGSIVVINHRMHEDDLSGYLIEKMKSEHGDQWEIVELPAINEDHEALWPESYPIEALERIKANTLPRFWSALYQQNPTPEEGTYFQASWFKRYRERPQNLHIYCTSDHAVKQDDGDYTVMRVWGVDPLGDLYMLDGFRVQETTDKWMLRAVDMIRKWKPHCWFPENDQAWRAVAPFVQRYMMQVGVACRREPLPTSGGDKPTKARGFQAMASMGRVWLPEQPWADDVLSEYLRFPAGKHDDEVDAAANIGRALDDAHPAIIRRAVKPDGPNDRYTRARPSSGSDNDWLVA